MAYRIVYGTDPIVQKHNTGTARIRILIALNFLIFAMVVRLLWPEGRELLVMQFLPGDPTMTEIAFSNLLDSLRQGSGMAESLTVFCREILYEIV